MSQAAYIQGMLAWDGPTNYVIIYYMSSGGGHAFLLKIRLCQVLALQYVSSGLYCPYEYLCGSGPGLLVC